MDEQLGTVVMQQPSELEKLPPGAPAKMQKAFALRIGKIKGQAEKRLGGWQRKLRKAEEENARLTAQRDVYKRIVARCADRLGPILMQEILQEEKNHRG